jgi:hypothetical protein
MGFGRVPRVSQRVVAGPMRACYSGRAMFRCVIANCSCITPYIAGHGYAVWEAVAPRDLGANQTIMSLGSRLNFFPVWLPDFSE